MTQKYKLNFKCLVLDHDDTSVDSTPHIHYPCYVEYMKTRPQDHCLTFEEWFKALWYKGLFGYYREDLHLTESEILEQVALSRQYAMTHERAHFFPGFIEMLQQFRALGGFICVVSFSDETNIYRVYKEETNDQFAPDVVYGWHEETKEQCKPYPYPIHSMMEKYGFAKEDFLVIDDMPQGIEMGKAAGVKCAGAMYGEGHEVLRKEMEECCDYICESVDDLKKLLMTPLIEE